VFNKTIASQDLIHETKQKYDY